MTGRVGRVLARHPLRSGGQWCSDPTGAWVALLWGGWRNDAVFFSSVLRLSRTLWRCHGNWLPVQNDGLWILILRPGSDSGHQKSWKQIHFDYAAANFLVDLEVEWRSIWTRVWFCRDVLMVCSLALTSEWSNPQILVKDVGLTCKASSKVLTRSGPAENTGFFIRLNAREEALTSHRIRPMWRQTKDLRLVVEPKPDCKYDQQNQTGFLF